MAAVVVEDGGEEAPQCPINNRRRKNDENIARIPFSAGHIDGADFFVLLNVGNYYAALGTGY